ncbi:MAG: hypothetical protein AAFV53_24855 [Myxococcota bacterium]
MTSPASPPPRSSGNSLGPILWIAGTILAAVLASPVDWRVGLLALAAAIFAGVRPGALSAGALALFSAPLWLQAALPLGAGSMVLGGIAGVGLLVSKPVLPRWLPWVLVALGALEGVRAGVSAWTFSQAAQDAPALVLAGGILGGVTSTARPSRWTAGAAALVFVGIAVGAGGNAARPLVDGASVRAAAGWRTLDAHVAQIVSDEALARAALAERPRWHAVASTLPVRVALESGWRPERAHLPERERVSVCRELMSIDREGEALRLIGRPQSPEAAWLQATLRRIAGKPAVVVLAGAPTDAFVLPGAHPVSRSFYTNADQDILVHAEVPLSAIVLTMSADLYQGGPSVTVGVDHGTRTIPEVTASPRRYVISGPFAAGGHRVRIQYRDDRSGPDGDRNLYISGVSGRP